MLHHNDLSEWDQIGKLQERLRQEKGLPFADLLPAELIVKAFAEAGVEFRDRVFNPSVTLWAFLSQALCPDGSCRKAVARVCAWRMASGMTACSSRTSSYCGARQRLPQQVLESLTRQVGRQLEEQAEDHWLWKRHHVKLADGSTASMPDTPENQQAFPQSSCQKPGLGFPLARLVVIFSLATGAILDLALGAAKGKKTGENTLFRSLIDGFEPGDLLLGDRLFDSYHDIALLRQRGADVLFRMNQSRRCDFRRGRWLGTLDHVVVWKKPKFDASRFDRETYDALPEQMQIRELRFRVQEKGFRPTEIVLVTTLLDPQTYTTEELAALYRERWHCELDLNALKTSMQMNHLSCLTPEMVRKEVWAHLLAYNLVRQTMGVAARRHDVLPRQISFKGAMQTIDSFVPCLALATSDVHNALLDEMLTAIASHRVGDRPGRVDPRKRKRRHSKYPYLTRPRAEEKQQLTS